MAAPRGIDLQGTAINLAQQERLSTAIAHDFGEQGSVIADQQQSFALTDQFQATIAADVFANIDGDVGRNGVFTIRIEQIQNALRVHAPGGGIPQGKRRKAVGMNVFWRFL